MYKMIIVLFMCVLVIGCVSHTRNDLTLNVAGEENAVGSSEAQVFTESQKRNDNMVRH